MTPFYFASYDLWSFTAKSGEEKSWCDENFKLEQAGAPETTLMRSLKYAWPWNWQKSKVDHEILSCCDTFLTETQRSDSIIEFKRIILIIKSSSLYSKLCLSKKIKKSFNDETLIQTLVESTVRNWTTTLSTRFESVSSQRDTIPYKLELLPIFVLRGWCA